MTSAITAFREVLDRQPGQARAHLGLAVARAALGEPDASSRAYEAATQALDDLRGAGRGPESAIVEASMLVTQHRPDRAAAVGSDAPPGPAGWSVPVEPFLQPLLGTTAFSRVRAMLAERAA